MAGCWALRTPATAARIRIRTLSQNAGPPPPCSDWRRDLLASAGQAPARLLNKLPAVSVGDKPVGTHESKCCCCFQYPGVQPSPARGTGGTSHVALAWSSTFFCVIAPTPLAVTVSVEGLLAGTYEPENAWLWLGTSDTGPSTTTSSFAFAVPASSVTVTSSSVSVPQFRTTPVK